MQRALLKLLVWTVCERWVRCTHAFDAHFAPHLLSDTTLAAADKALLHDARTRLNTIATLWTKEPALAEFLLDDAPADPTRVQGFLEQSVYGPYKMLRELTLWLLQGATQHANPRVIPAELPLLWRDILDDEAQMALGYRSIAWVAEGEQRQWPGLSEVNAPHLPNFSSHMVQETMSVLDAASPLDWTSSMRGAAWRWASQQVERAILTVLPGKKSFLTQFRNATDDQRHYGTRLLAEAALMQWIGPVWYLQSLLHGLLGKSPVWLHLVEPSLFFGLGYTNGLDADIVKLHESVERYKAVLAGMLPRHDLPILSHDDIQALWETVDDLIPENQRFTSRHLERAQSLVPALSNNLLIASRPVYPVDAIRERLEALYQADTADAVAMNRDAVYAALNMTTELPNSPREIITAGWLEAMQQLPETVSMVFEPRETGTQPLVAFGDALRQKDYLLRKSLETTTLHEMLLTKASH